MKPSVTKARAIARWLLAAVLAWSGVAKAIAPAVFAKNIMGFALVPWPVAVGLAFYLPWLEVVVACGLVVPRWRSGASWMAAVLFAGFTLVWAITWIRGIDVSCGCFGGSGEGLGAAWSLVRVGLLAAIACWVCAGEIKAQADAGAA